MRILSVTKKKNGVLPRGAERRDAPEVETKVISLAERAKDEGKSYLEELLSEGARKLLQTAIENEVADYLEIHQERRTDAGERAIVRNGPHPERELVSGIGPLKVRQPRIPPSRWAEV